MVLIGLNNLKNIIDEEHRIELRTTNTEQPSSIHKWLFWAVLFHEFVKRLRKEPNLKIKENFATARMLNLLWAAFALFQMKSWQNLGNRNQNINIVTCISQWQNNKYGDASKHMILLN